MMFGGFGAGGASGYSMDWIKFNSGASCTVNSGFDMTTSSKVFLLSFSVHFAVSLPTTDAWCIDPENVSSSNRGHFRFNGSTLKIRLETSSGGPVFNLDQNISIVADTSYDILIAGNSASGSERLQIVVNGSTIRNGSDGVTTDAVIGSITKMAIGCRNPQTPNAHLGAEQDAYLADLWFSLKEEADITQAAIQNAFAEETSKGVDGSAPTGTAPEVFLSGAVASWHTNKGSEGGFVENGTLLAAPI